MRKLNKLLFIEKAIFILILTFFFISCGLSSYIYIYPPLSGITTVGFSHDSRNNKEPDFFVLGYDIYYRIYDSNIFIDMDDSGIRNTIIGDSTAYFNSANIGNLINRNINAASLYRPLFYVSDDKNNGYDSNNSAPVLPIDNSQITDTQFYINLIFGGNNGPYIETASPYGSDNLPEKIFFKRYISLQESKEFVTFTSTDIDVPDTLTSNNVLIAFFVLSYGSTVDFYTLTSDKPLFIGYNEFY